MVCYTKSSWIYTKELENRYSKCGEGDNTIFGLIVEVQPSIMEHSVAICIQIILYAISGHILCNMNAHENIKILVNFSTVVQNVPKINGTFYTVSI